MGLPSAMAPLPPSAVIPGGGPALPPEGATDFHALVVICTCLPISILWLFVFTLQFSFVVVAFDHGINCYG
jgi:hypothetical protein